MVSLSDRSTEEGFVINFLVVYVPDCKYVTYDVDSAIVAALITAHCNATHDAAGPSATTAKVEKIKRLTIAAAGTSEDCVYCLTRWTD